MNCRYYVEDRYYHGILLSKPAPFVDNDNWTDFVFQDSADFDKCSADYILKNYLIIEAWE